MKNPKKTWAPSPGRFKLSELQRILVESEARPVIEALKERHLKAPPENPQFNYLQDIWSRWRRGFFYVGGTYVCVYENCITPTFEAFFARLRPVGKDAFDLAYYRHTNQWWELPQYSGSSLKECLEAIQTEPYFIPV